MRRRPRAGELRAASGERSRMAAISRADYMLEFVESLTTRTTRTKA
jgi:hypothetical protein